MASGLGVYSKKQTHVTRQPNTSALTNSWALGQGRGERSSLMSAADISELRSPRPWPSAQELVSAEVFGCLVTCVCFFEYTPSPLAIRPMFFKSQRVPLASFSGEKIAAVDVYGTCKLID